MQHIRTLPKEGEQAQPPPAGSAVIEGPILLTGGTGFLGSHVADRLAAQGVEIRALVRQRSDTRHLDGLQGVTLVPGELGDPESLRSAMRGIRGVIHTAGLIKARRLEDFHRVNAQGTANLLAAVREAAGVERFVHVSSLAAAGPSPDGRPRPHGTPPAPLTAYGRSKLAAERRVREATGALRTVIIRPPLIHGPRDRETLLLYRAIQFGIIPLTGSPHSVLSTVCATDCADACVAAVTADVPGGSVFEVDDGEPLTLAKLLIHLEAALGRPARWRVPIPGPLLQMAALAAEGWGRATGRPVMLTRDKVRELRAPHWVCHGTPALTSLGWSPQLTFLEGARQSVAWYRQMGWL